MPKSTSSAKRRPLGPISTPLQNPSLGISDTLLPFSSQDSRPVAADFSTASSTRVDQRRRKPSSTYSRPESFVPTHPYALLPAKNPPLPSTTQLPATLTFSTSGPAPPTLVSSPQGDIQFGVALASPLSPLSRKPGCHYQYEYEEESIAGTGGNRQQSQGYQVGGPSSRIPAPPSSDTDSTTFSPSSVSGTQGSTVPSIISGRSGASSSSDNGDRRAGHLRASSAKDTLREMMEGPPPPVPAPPPQLPLLPPPTSSSAYPLYYFYQDLTPTSKQPSRPPPPSATSGVGMGPRQLTSGWDTDDDDKKGLKKKKSKDDLKNSKKNKKRRRPTEDEIEVITTDAVLPAAEKLIEGPRFSVNTVMRDVVGAQERVLLGKDRESVRPVIQELPSQTTAPVSELSQEVLALLNSSKSVAPKPPKPKGLRGLFSRRPSDPPTSSLNPQPLATSSEVGTKVSTASRPRNVLRKRRPTQDSGPSQTSFSGSLSKDRPLLPLPSGMNESPLRPRRASHGAIHPFLNPETQFLAERKRIGQLRRTSSLPSFPSPGLHAESLASQQIHPIIASLPVDRRLRSRRADRAPEDTARRLAAWLNEVELDAPGPSETLSLSEAVRNSPRPQRKELGYWVDEVAQQTGSPPPSMTPPAPAFHRKDRSSPSSSLVPHSPGELPTVTRPWIANGARNGSLDLPRSPSVDPYGGLRSPSLDPYGGMSASPLPSPAPPISNLAYLSDGLSTPTLDLNPPPMPPKPHKSSRVNELRAESPVAGRRVLSAADSLLDPYLEPQTRPGSVVLDVIENDALDPPDLSTSLSSGSFTLSQSAEKKLFFRPPPSEPRRRVVRDHETDSETATEVEIGSGQVAVRRAPSLVKASSLSRNGGGRAQQVLSVVSDYDTIPGDSLNRVDARTLRNQLLDRVNSEK